MGRRSGWLGKRTWWLWVLRWSCLRLRWDELRWIERWWGGLWEIAVVLEVRRSIRLLGRDVVAGRVVVVGEVWLEVVVGVVGGVLVAPI